jgi:transketolase
MLLYSLLHLSGFDLPLAEIQRFRQWGSMTPGHPEFGHAPGVETTTGPLGQGFTNGVGMAIAAHHLAARYNREGRFFFDHRVYGIVSDGDLMERRTQAALAGGHLRLGRLIYHGDNRISIDGGKPDLHRGPPLASGPTAGTCACPASGTWMRRQPSSGQAGLA